MSRLIEFIEDYFTGSEGEYDLTCESEPLEITSGAIYDSPLHESLMEVEAVTSRGRWKLRAIKPKHLTDEQLQLFLRRAKYHRTSRSFQWSDAPTVITPVPGRHVLQVAQLASYHRRLGRQHVESESNANELVELSNYQIIEGLSSPTAAERDICDIVLKAEVREFGQEEFAQIAPLLFQFIASNRFSDNSEEMIAVGSAIRKLVMNMPLSEFDSLAEYFDPKDTDSIPCEIELELVKAVTWRLTLEPPQTEDAFPELSGRLIDIAATYLKPRLITQKNYAAVALNSVLASLLLRSHRVEDIVDQLESLNARWFTDLVVRRCQQLRNDISQRFSTEEAGKFNRCLLEAEERLQRCFTQKG